MPDDDKTPVPWYKDSTKILMIIAALTGMINVAGNVINNVISNWNHTQAVDNGKDIRVVTAKQDAQADATLPPHKAMEVKNAGK